MPLIIGNRRGEIECGINLYKRVIHKSCDDAVKTTGIVDTWFFKKIITTDTEYRTRITSTTWLLIATRHASHKRNQQQPQRNFQHDHNNLLDPHHNTTTATGVPSNAKTCPYMAAVVNDALILLPDRTKNTATAVRRFTTRAFANDLHGAPPSV